MGLSLFAYLLLALSGGWMLALRQQRQSRPQWLRPLHFLIGSVMVLLVWLLLAIGVVGTIGHYGNLGHSSHLTAGLTAVNLTFLSAWSAVQIRADRPWARPLHIGVNSILFVGFIWVSITGWDVVQKYLPK